MLFNALALLPIISFVIATPIPQDNNAQLESRALTTQSANGGLKFWPLGRISHRQKSINDYLYDDSACAGMRIYLVGSGIRTTHQEFEGRAIWGTNLVPNSPNTDENGGGTHIAGIIAGKTIGVCKKATVIAVKVLDSNGSSPRSRIVAGLQWAANDATKFGKYNAVIQITSTGDQSDTYNESIQKIIDQNIPVVVGAGMDNNDVANYSPASAKNAITVGATDMSDARLSGSNYGAGIDIFAPGFNINSCGTANDSAYISKTGTNMAAGYVSGLAAYYMAKEFVRGPDAIRNRLVSRATTGVISGLNGSPNVLAFNSAGM